MGLKTTMTRSEKGSEAMIAHRNWVQTASGAAVDLLNPDPATIHPDDIVTALTRLVRFNGHTVVPYTVAQHSVLVARLTLTLALQAGRGAVSSWPLALLHDAHEAYMGDIVNPVLWLPGLKTETAALKARLDTAIHRRFGLTLDQFDAHDHALVERADRLACAIEKRDLLGDCAVPWEGLAVIPAIYDRERGFDLRVMLEAGSLDGFKADIRALTPP
jgi:5'-deoxynucleotidase YfbR-like HD superfamily hydrolase